MVHIFFKCDFYNACLLKYFLFINKSKLEEVDAADLNNSSGNNVEKFFQALYENKVEVTNIFLKLLIILKGGTQIRAPLCNLRTKIKSKVQKFPYFPLKITQCASKVCHISMSLSRTRLTNAFVEGKKNFKKDTFSTLK